MPHTRRRRLNRFLSLPPAKIPSLRRISFSIFSTNLKKSTASQALVSGLKVTTTLDADLETKAESICEYVRASECKRILMHRMTALVAIDPPTGQILAMVGSRNFFDTDIDGQYNATLAPAPAGFHDETVHLFSRAYERLYARYRRFRCADAILNRRAIRPMSRTAPRPVMRRPISITPSAAP